jgi:hypothetical protein
MKIVTRAEVSKTDQYYRLILKTEKHHDHPIIQDEHGVIRWQENKEVRETLQNISLNDLIQLLCLLGYDKNSEVFRKLYRDMGYSLFGYWEIFYWEVNNEEAHKYVPDKLPSNDDATDYAYDKVFKGKFKTRQVFKDTEDDHYYSGFLDCLKWIKSSAI